MSIITLMERNKINNTVRIIRHLLLITVVFIYLLFISCRCCYYNYGYNPSCLSHSQSRGQGYSQEYLNMHEMIPNSYDLSGLSILYVWDFSMHI